MSSAKTVTKEYLAACEKRILKTFNTRKEAVAFEVYLHEKFDVGKNPRFFNAAKQTSTGFDTSGIKLSKEHRQKVIKTLVPLKKPTEQSKKKNALAHTGFNNARAKVANIYDYSTDKLIAKNVCLGSYATSHNLRSSHLYETANNKRKQHKGVYAKYIL